MLAREEILALHKRLKNSENFFKTLGIYAALEEVIAPYQLWSQREDISVLEREWMKQKMTQKIDSMVINDVSEEIEDQLNKIDFRRRRWKKSDFLCNKLRNISRNKTIEMIFDMKMKILKVFLRHKKEIHEENDPKGMKQISKIFDIRWWEVCRLENIDTPENEMVSHVFEMMKRNLEEGKDFIKGENIGAIENYLKLIVSQLMKCVPLLKKACGERNLKSQWNLILQYPSLNELKRVPGFQLSSMESV